MSGPGNPGRMRVCPNTTHLMPLVVKPFTSGVRCVVQIKKHWSERLQEQSLLHHHDTGDYSKETLAADKCVRKTTKAYLNGCSGAAWA